MSTPPFDAVLLIAFGGPRHMDDIRPFLQNVLRGRRIPPERIDAVAQHYERFDGVSPISAITDQQARALQDRLATRHLRLPVHVGARNWSPLLVDTLQNMTERGVRRVVGVVAAAHRSYSSCEQYMQNVWQAQEELRAAGMTPPAIVYTGDWHTHPGFVAAAVDAIDASRRTLPEAMRARLVFTAHAIPAGMSAADRYQEQLAESARAVAKALDTENWTIAYQSRSGRPEDPWLEPDVNDYLREHRDELDAVILSPLGFVADHIEVLYDLDIEARETCDALALPMARAAAVNAHAGFIEALADSVIATVERYAKARPLSVLPADAPAKREPPPPVRPK